MDFVLGLGCGAGMVVLIIVIVALRTFRGNWWGF